MSIKISIEEIINFAKQRGGYLLSDEYINNKQKLLWKCNCGNKWSASWVNIWLDAFILYLVYTLTFQLFYGKILLK